MMAYPSTDDLADEMERHTWRVRPTGVVLVSSFPPTSTTDTTYSSNSPTDTAFSTFDCSSNYAYLSAICYEDEEEQLRLEALAMKQRDLSYLYRPKLPLVRAVLRHAPRIIFQPCWSKRRWKSLT